MAYDPADPTLRDKARRRLRDVGTPPILEDAAYDDFLGDETITETEALARIAESIGLALTQSSGLKLKLGDQSFEESSGNDPQFYFDLAVKLRVSDPGRNQGARAGLIGGIEPYRPHNPLCDPPYGYPFGPRCR